MCAFLRDVYLKLWQIYLVLGLIWLQHFRAMELDFTVDVPGGKMECFFQNITEEKYKTAEIDYQVSPLRA